MGDEEEEVEETEVRLLAVNDLAVYHEALADRMRMICIVWVLPQDKNCDGVRKFFAQFSADPATANSKILLLNPEKFPQLAQSFMLAAVPTLQMYWRADMLHNVTTSNPQKVKAYFLQAMNVRNNVVSEELRWSRHAPTANRPNKGDKLNIMDQLVDSTCVRVAIGWKPLAGLPPAPAFEYSVLGICLRDTGKIAAITDLIRQQNPTDAKHSVNYLGQQFLGDGTGDNETFEIVMEEVDNSVKEILFFIIIVDGAQRQQFISLFQEIYFRVYDRETAQVACKYNFDVDAPEDEEGDASKPTAVLLARTYRTGSGKWKMQALGQPLALTLEELELKYVEKKKEPKKRKPKTKQSADD